MVTKRSFANNSWQPKKRHCKGLQKIEVSKKFTLEQQQIMNLLFHERLNVFITGAAGTGKSFILESLPLLCPHNITILMTASTATIAREINGITFHSCFGLTPMLASNKTSLNDAIKAAATSSSVRNRLSYADLLIVDEISMISAQLLSKADGIARAVRNNYNLPFGGLQIVFMGDFCQLPPVQIQTSIANEALFAFESESWKETIDVVAELRSVLRQQTCPEFFDALSSLRTRGLSAAVRSYFDQFRHPEAGDTHQILSSIVQMSVTNGWTCLFLTNQEVQNHNNKCHEELLKNIKADIVEIPSIVITFKTQRAIEKGVVEYPSWLPKELSLTKNSPIIISQTFTAFKKSFQSTFTSTSINQQNNGEQRRISKSLVISNGTCGHVVGFEDFSYLSQLSKEKLLNDLYDEDFQTLGDSGNTAMKKKDLLNALNKFFEICLWHIPVVEFKRSEIASIEQVLVFPVFIHEEFLNVSYLQLPLLLKWGITIHRSQGLTLSKVCLFVNPSTVRYLTFGALYVAASRVRHPNDLRIYGELPSSLAPDDRIIEFYSNLKNCHSEYLPNV